MGVPHFLMTRTAQNVDRQWLLSAVKQLSDECGTENCHYINDSHAEYILGHFDVILVDEDQRGFIAGQLAPHAVLGTPILYCTLLWVSKEHRRNGVANSLIRAFTEYAQQVGSTHVVVSFGGHADISDSSMNSLGFKFSEKVYIQEL